jgi:hypothetical protein
LGEPASRLAAREGNAPPEWIESFCFFFQKEARAFCLGRKREAGGRMDGRIKSGHDGLGVDWEWALRRDVTTGLRLAARNDERSGAQ